MGRTLYHLFAFGMATLMLLNVAVSVDQDQPYRRLGIHEDQKLLYVSFTMRDLFLKSVQDKLRCGLPTRVLLQAKLEKRGDKEPLAYTARTVEIVYDLWDEVFVVTTEDAFGRHQTRVKTEKEVLEAALVLNHEPFFSTAELAKGMYRLHVVAEVNPVSKEMIEEIRQWLAYPRATRHGESRTNFFGSFVGVFVDRKIGKADHSVGFVSQWFAAGAL